MIIYIVMIDLIVFGIFFEFIRIIKNEYEFSKTDFYKYYRTNGSYSLVILGCISLMV